uniref:Gamma-soluble NSF attachment protein n=1 Tax=Araucaria cunninghamii TaxID=56994 RepID=A0A0D6R4D1_ARACU
MAETEPKVAEAEKMMKKANKLTKLSFTRWSADWNTATTLYEQAALAFRLAKETEKAKEAFDRAATGQERLSSPWQAAKHLESAGALAKELENWNEVADYYKRASELYTECGRPQPASDALARGARALEDAVPDEALRMYIDSCALLEDEGKEQMAFDTYRAVTNLYLKLERFSDAATILVRWGLAADKCKAINSQCKAYLSAIIVYLYAHDFKQADQCYNDCSQIDVFSNSEQNYCAEKLLRAYREADVEEIKHITKSSSAISGLDHTIIRLARKLPTGDVNAVASSAAAEEEPLDENDLT